MCLDDEVHALHHRIVKCEKCSWQGTLSECNVKESALLPVARDFACPACSATITLSGIPVLLISQPEQVH